MISSDSADMLDSWVERATSFFAEHYGVPPVMGRLWALLMVCDPPEQSGAQIAAAIGASRASVSTNARLLIATGLIQPTTRPGERTTYYRIHDDAWETVVRRRLESIAGFQVLAQEAVELIGAGSPRARRLEATQEIFDWMARALADGPTAAKGYER